LPARLDFVRLQLRYMARGAQFAPEQNRLADESACLPPPV
jgi:hypothetical protein